MPDFFPSAIARVDQPGTLRSDGGARARNIHTQEQRNALLLLVPGITVYGALLGIPLFLILRESFGKYIPGRIGSNFRDGLVLENYSELLSPAYIYYFLDTFMLSCYSSLAALVFGFLIAFMVSQKATPRVRSFWIAFLVAMLFLSVLVRVYAVMLAFGPFGILRPLAQFMGLNQNSSWVAYILVFLGLVHSAIPSAALTLIGTLQNIDPRFVDAAKSLGASGTVAHFTITLPLSASGLLSAFLINFSLSASAFVIPLILGKGQIVFVSALVYRRFADVSNYPSGAAIAIIMLILTLVIVQFFSALVAKLEGRHA